ncbi:hypothetical protein ACRAWD_00460 [Caulobacter segnis]
MLIGGTTAHLSPPVAAGWRVAEITVGSIVGVAATLLIFRLAPTRRWSPTSRRSPACRHTSSTTTSCCCAERPGPRITSRPRTTCGRRWPSCRPP